MKIKEMPRSEKPREKLVERGAGALTDAELLAILLGTGTSRHQVLDLAQLILNAQGGEGLAGLRRLGYGELKKLPGIGDAKATKLIAALEIGRRAAKPKAAGILATTAEMAAFFQGRFAELDLAQENFLVLSLDVSRRPLSCRLISRGTVSKALVHPREVLKEAIKAAATSFAVAHNHPSGEPAPSADDVILTRRIMAAATVVGIEFIDHIIIGRDNFVSLKDEGMLK